MGVLIMAKIVNVKLSNIEIEILLDYMDELKRLNYHVNESVYDKIKQTFLNM